MNTNASFGKKGQCLKLEDMNLTFLGLGTPSGERFYRSRKYRKIAKARCVTHRRKVSHEAYLLLSDASLTNLKGLLVLLLLLKLGKEQTIAKKKSYLPVLLLQFIICTTISSRNPSYRPEIIVIKV